MTSTLISVAVQSVRTILHLTEMYQLQDTRMQELTDRVISLEQPLVILENRPYHAISEQAVQKLVDTLDDLQKMIEKHNKASMKSKTKRFILGDANVAKIQHINERLDSSLLDLHLAMQVEQSEKEEQRSGITAQTTVDLLLTSVKQRAIETILLCVQCGQEYRQSENAEGSCKYHIAAPTYANWKITVACCGKTADTNEAFLHADAAGCTRGVHSSVHHFDYPYTACYIWMRNQLNNNVKDTFLKVEDIDYEDNQTKYAWFGSTNNPHKLFVAIGKGYTPLYFEYFSIEYPIFAPEDHSEVTGGNLWPIALRGTDSLLSVHDKSKAPGKWEASAHWLVDFRANGVTGIRLSAQSHSSKGPIMKSVNFRFDPFTLTNKPVLVSSPVITPHISFTHAFPPCATKYTPFPEYIFQETPLEPEYETVVKGNMKVRLKKVGKCKANVDVSGFKHDTFTIELLVMNLALPQQQGSSSDERMIVLNLLKDGKTSVDETLRLLGALDSSPHSDGPLTFIEISANARVDDKWVEVQALKVVPGADKEENRINAVPFNVAPRNASKLIVTMNIPCPDKKANNWWGRAFTARLNPVQIDLHIEEMSGAKASITSVYHNPPAWFSEHDPKALFWFYVESVSEWEREMLQVLPRTDSQGPEVMFQIKYSGRGIDVTFTKLQVWGYGAWKEKQPHYKLEESTENVTVTALVDLVSRVVCGFHFRVKIKEDYNEGIWMIPDDLMQAGRKASMDPLLYESIAAQLPQAYPDTAVSPPGVGGVGAVGGGGWNKVIPTGASSNNLSAPTPAPSTGATLSPSAGARPLPTQAKPAPVKPVPAVRPPPATGAPPSAVLPSRPPPAATSSPAPTTTSSPAAAPARPLPTATSSPAPVTNATSSLAPAHATSSPAPATNAPELVAPSAKDAEEVLKTIAPAPIKPTAVATASTDKPAGPNKRAFKCGKCSTGPSKNGCVRCLAIVPKETDGFPALLCISCLTSFKDKCVKCNSFEMAVANRVPATLCKTKCANSMTSQNCVRCGKRA